MLAINRFFMRFAETTNRPQFYSAFGSILGPTTKMDREKSTEEGTF